MRGPSECDSWYSGSLSMQLPSIHVIVEHPHFSPRSQRSNRLVASLWASHTPLAADHRGSILFLFMVLLLCTRHLNLIESFTKLWQCRWLGNDYDSSKNISFIIMNSTIIGPHECYCFSSLNTGRWRYFRVR